MRTIVVETGRSLSVKYPAVAEHHFPSNTLAILFLITYGAMHYNNSMVQY